MRERETDGKKQEEEGRDDESAGGNLQVERADRRVPARGGCERVGTVNFF